MRGLRRMFRRNAAEGGLQIRREGTNRGVVAEVYAAENDFAILPAR